MYIEYSTVQYRGEFDVIMLSLLHVVQSSTAVVD